MSITNILTYDGNNGNMWVRVGGYGGAEGFHDVMETWEGVVVGGCGSDGGGRVWWYMIVASMYEW